jgi:hypothetical protein
MIKHLSIYVPYMPTVQAAVKALATSVVVAVVISSGYCEQPYRLIETR